mgnify:CR=1 FL=1
MDLLGSLYPPQVRLFRPALVEVSQCGHTQVFACSGSCHTFKNRVIHDDRKSCDRWLQAQYRYSELEARRIQGSLRPLLKDQLRRSGAMPLIAGLASYIRAGGPLKGRAAWRYALERSAFEMILSLRLHRGDTEATDHWMARNRESAHL